MISDGNLLSELTRIRALGPSDLGPGLVGEQLDHFELLEFVGGGGMGAVFRARDTQLNREVALKILSRDQGSDDETRRRFQNEAQAAARLDHENIARVYYVGEDQGLYYIVFEFIAGVNVRDLVEKKGPLSLSDAISITLQVADALSHASRRDVVHRDIKPSNIIITEQRRAKLVDMGLARQHHVQAPGEDLTASGVTLGTFDYISPEQARDPRGADVRSDIYSLGCTLYFMLTGRPPFPDGTVLQKLLQHQGDEAPDPRAVRADLPDALAVLLARMLAKDPRKRFQTADQLIAALVQLADETGIRAHHAGGAVYVAAAPAQADWERHLPWIVPVVALLAIVAAIEWFGGARETRLTPLPPGPIAAAPDAQATKTDGTSKSATHSNVAPPNTTAGEKVPNANGSATAKGPGTNNAAQGSVADKATVPGTPVESSTAANGSPSDATAVRVAEGLTDSRGAGTGLRQPDLKAGVTAGQGLIAGLSSADAKTRRATDGGPSPEPGTANAVEPQAPAVATDRISIVGGNGEPRRTFPSLAAACSAARNNDVIELRYSGRQLEQPIVLTNVNLTIRADARYQPVIAFRPTMSGVPGFPRSMISVAGGRLQLVNVGVDLDIPRDATADHLSLFESQRAEEIRLERCSLTIRNATERGETFYPGVAFFTIKASPGSDSMMRDRNEAPQAPVVIELHDCLARGEAVFLRNDEVQPLKLVWENGVLATTEQLLSAAGGANAPSGGKMQLDLRHITALVRGGLCRLTNTADLPYLPETEIKCRDSVIVGGPDRAAIEQSGVSRGTSWEQQFVWKGDHNVWAGYYTFLKVVDIKSPAEAVERPFESAEVVLPATPTMWRQALPTDRPMHRFEPRDFLLRDATPGDMARFGASDGRAAGVEIENMPPMAAEPVDNGLQSGALPIDPPSEPSGTTVPPVEGFEAVPQFTPQ